MALISVDELSELLGQVTLLDVRYRVGSTTGAEEYAAGHLPGAVYVDLDRDLSGSVGEGRHPLPAPEDLQAAMRAAGVRDDRPVVVYDDWSAHAAARCWWLLRHHGHPSVRVLDGGWAAWQRAGGPTQSGASASVEPGDFTVDPGHLPVVEAADVPQVGVLIDARARERYLGEVEPIDPVAGHIPGAINVPTTTNLRVDGTFRSPEELRALYAAAGVSDEVARDTTVAAYCGSGVTACHGVLALELVGIEAALYPGSWSGWITDPQRPTSGRP